MAVVGHRVGGTAGATGRRKDPPSRTSQVACPPLGPDFRPQSQEYILLFLSPPVYGPLPWPWEARRLSFLLAFIIFFLNLGVVFRNKYSRSAKHASKFMRALTLLVSCLFFQSRLHLGGLCFIVSFPRHHCPIQRALRVTPKMGVTRWRGVNDLWLLPFGALSFLELFHKTASFL